jgi:hypothetical protein
LTRTSSQGSGWSSSFGLGLGLGLGLAFTVFAVATTSPPALGADFTTPGISGFGSTVFTFSNTTPADSLVLRTACSSVSVGFAPDIAGVATGATAHVFRCDSLDVGTCKKILADRDLDGVAEDIPLNGDVIAQRAGYQFVQTPYVQVKGAHLGLTSSGGITAQISVRCQGE